MDEAKLFKQRPNIGSRVTREGHARFWERPEVQFLRATRQRDASIAAMRGAADLDDASEKNVAMENKLVSIRTLLAELYLVAGMSKEALVEFEASDKVMPNRFRTVAGAASAARATGSVEAAKRYYRELTGLAVGGDGDRSEVAEARTYLAQN